MGRVLTTLAGIAVVAIAAILIAKGMLRPTAEKAQRNAPVLTGRYEAQLDDCRALTDNELPEGLVVPKVDEDLLYVEVAVHFPGAVRVEDADKYKLVEINGVIGTSLIPVHTDVQVDDDGAMLFLVFKTDHAFEAAKLMRGGDIVVDAVELQ